MMLLTSYDGSNGSFTLFPTLLLLLLLLLLTTRLPKFLLVQNLISKFVFAKNKSNIVAMVFGVVSTR